MAESNYPSFQLAERDFNKTADCFVRNHPYGIQGPPSIRPLFCVDLKYVQIVLDKILSKWVTTSSAVCIEQVSLWGLVTIIALSVFILTLIAVFYPSPILVPRAQSQSAFFSLW